jgi:hypothetical protein
MNRCVMLLLLIAVIPALAQDAPGWDVVLLERETGTIYTVTSKGIASSMVITDLAQFSSVSNYLLTPDRSKLVFAHTPYAPRTSDATTTIYAADVSAGTCCAPIISAPYGTLDTPLMTLSPEGTQLVMGVHEESSVDGTRSHQVKTFDITTGEVTAALDISRLIQPDPYQRVSCVILGEWKEDGVRLVSRCMGRGEGLGTFGVFQIWNPPADELSDLVEPYDFFTRELPTTGERIRVVQNDAFRHEPDTTNAHFTTPNVVEYFADASMSTPIVIFYNPYNLHLTYAEWILDGEAVLIRYSDAANLREASTESYILFRDGRWFRLEIPVNQSFLSGTPDGWMMSDYEAKTFVNYTVAGFKQVDSTVVDSYIGEAVKLLQPASMGTNRTFAPFS